MAEEYPVYSLDPSQKEFPVITIKELSTPLNFLGHWIIDDTDVTFTVPAGILKQRLIVFITADHFIGAGAAVHSPDIDAGTTSYLYLDYANPDTYENYRTWSRRLEFHGHLAGYDDVWSSVKWTGVKNTESYSVIAYFDSDKVDFSKDLKLHIYGGPTIREVLMLGY